MGALVGSVEELELLDGMGGRWGVLGRIKRGVLHWWGVCDMSLL